MDSSISLVEIGSRIPEVLGNFHLDDHNVEEWSDAAVPGVRHNARQESGKWINPDSNADIKYQKREDCKQSDRSKEQTLIQVIEGQAPDSTFQIVRSHSQFQDVDDTSNSRVQTSTTSYQMSSSRGVRSTSKSTSNRTTTKTVTVSGGRSDDFENLGMSFQPLDTSTQRERINVSRSGTMGIRRPPTRRHTPAATVSSSPDDDNIDTRDEIIVDSDDNMRNTPDMERNTLQVPNPTGVSIIGFKNISPKIRVGFPLEIQLELQTKLRASSNMGRGLDDDDDTNTFRKPSSINKNKESGSTYHNHPSTIIVQDSHMEIDQVKRSSDESATPLFELSANNEDSTFDFKQRRKSYGFESFDSHAKQSLSERTTENIDVQEISECDMIFSSPKNTNPVTFHHSISNSQMDQKSIERKTSADKIIDVQAIRSVSHVSRLSPTSISRSWDLIQSAHTAQQRREENKKLFHTGSPQQSYVPLITDKTFNKRTIPKLNSTQKTIVTLNADEESRFQESRTSGNNLEPYPMDSLDSTLDISNTTNRSSVAAKQEETEIPTGYIPDVLDHETSTLSPSLERSRKLLKMLDETPDLLHKMSYKNYFSDGFKLEERQWADDKGSTDWETQRQLSFLNDSLTRILEDGRNKENICYDDKTGKNSIISNDYINDDTISPGSAADELFSKRIHHEFLDEQDIDCNGNVKSRIGQVSQTWISSGDPQKPSQRVRDNDVTTSISATNDPFKRGPKKVEFCKTEVHFTADSGKFHIVETDENKPSTSHLFRKKKKGDKGKQSSTSSLSVLQDKLLFVKPTTVQDEIVQDGLISDVSMYVHNRSDGEGRELKNGVGAVESLLFQHHLSDKEGKSEQDETISRGAPPTITSAPNSHSTVKQSITSDSPYIRTTNITTTRDSNNPITNSMKKSLPLLSLRRESLTAESDETFGRSQMNINDVGADDDTQSPSHMILSNYGEMKIQRYLKQLTSSSSQNGSESPTELFDSVLHHDHDHSNHFRFDNVLYENGSFVPLATRRSLIEMNNRNRKRNITSHTSGNSSTMSNYSLPNSDKDNSTTSSTYQPLRLARMEAKVATARANPQITSVELRYELDNERPYNPEPILNRQNHLTIRQQMEHEKRNYVPSPVMPSEMKSGHNNRNDDGRFLYSDSPDEETELAKRNNNKPPTPVLPVNYKTFEKGELYRDRSYYKNPSCGCDSGNQLEQINSYKIRPNELAMSTSSVTSKSNNSKGSKSSKSIVTIGDYETCQSSAERNQNSVLEGYNDKSETLSPEPVLSMDHTWKGPAHFEHENTTANKGVPVIRSLTFPKSSRISEPEWVSKARSRDSRMTDWDLIGKQSASVTPIKTEPPWMDEIIRFRSKSTTEEVKTLPKISVVYPWQRQRDISTRNNQDDDDDDGRHNDELEEETHILSIVPTPALLSSRKEKTQGASVSKSTVQSTVHSTKSMTELPVLLPVSKRDIVDRDSDSILINPTRILKKAEETNTRQRLRSHSHIKSSGGGLNDRSQYRAPASGITGESLSIENRQQQLEDTSIVTISSSKSRHVNKSSGKDHSETKHSINTNEHSGKPTRPPPRVSSLSKPDTTGNSNQSKTSKTSGQIPQKEKAVGKGKTVLKKSELEESSGSSRSNTPIHRHPLVKVSKLPIRKNLAGKNAAESKPFSTSLKGKNKDKQNVAVNMDTKQSQSGSTQLVEPAKPNSPTRESSSKTKKSGERRNVEQKSVKPVPYSNSNRKK